MIDFSRTESPFTSRQRKIFLITLFGCITTLLISLFLGSYNISFESFLNNSLSTIEKEVLFNIRFPRVIFSIFVGAALSLSGACLQGLFRNPLADPGLIGVSAGAALGAATAIVIGNSLFTKYILSSFFVPISAVIGSAITIILLLILTKGFGKSSIIYLLLAGIAINAFAGVGIGILTYISDDSELRGLSFWTMGSFGGVQWITILPSITILTFCFLWILRLSKKLDIIQLGEIEAFNLGIDTEKLKLEIIISSAIIVGVSVSLVGMIGFVGLIVPHIVRMMGGPNHKYVLFNSMLLGGLIMILADLISRNLISPAELPVGLITSAIGSPFFIWLIYKLRK